ncbi:MAG TPA: hypothetical protein PKH31_03160 [Candidatus Sumerlaeota bacterium]|nr:hypothetical protein [Candidatus Sumerlaeota bacterium]
MTPTFRALFLLSFLALAASSTQGESAISDLSNYYTITYKDLNPAIQPVIGFDYIRILDPTAVGTLKIKKKKGFAIYPAIHEVVTAGTLTKIICDTPLSLLQADGDLPSVTFKKTYANQVLAREVGSVKMTGFARTHSSAGGEWFQTGIYSFGSTTSSTLSSPAIAPSPGLSKRKLKINLAGVSLADCIAPTQEVTIKMASKSWKTSEKIKDVSLATLIVPYEEPEEPTVAAVSAGSAIIAGHLTLLSVTGGGYAPVSPGGICADMISCYGLANKPSKIVAKGMLFTFNAAVPALTAKAAKTSYKEFFNGTIYPGVIHSGAPKLDIQAVYGDVKAYSYIVTAGSIGKITAKAKRLVLGHKGDATYSVSLIGGYYSVPMLQTGIREGLTLQATAAGSTDIGLIKADLGINWEPAWVEETTDTTTELVLVALRHPDYTICAGFDGQAKIGSLQSQKVGSKLLDETVKSLGGPYICGQGFAATPGTIQGGVSDGYFVWNPKE